MTVRMNRDRKYTSCTVVGCLGGASDSFGMFRHFAYRHPSLTLTVDGRTWEKCALCGMQTANPDRHWKSDTCKKLQVRRSNEKAALKQWEAERVEFTINGEKIERVKEFRYLGRILTEDDDDSRCIEDQLKKARSIWWRMAKLLKREGANPLQMGRFYMAVVQAVLLYGSESWTITLRDMKALERFQKKAARYMTGSHLQRDNSGEWHYPEHGKLYRI